MDSVVRVDPGLGRALALSGAVLAGDVLDDLVQRTLELAVLTVGGAHSASVTVVHHERYQTSNATGTPAMALDGDQYADEGGPCLEAILTGDQVHITIVGSAAKWPRFAATAAAAGVGAVVATPLFDTASSRIGALNIYLDDPVILDEREHRIVNALAAETEILVRSALDLLGAQELQEHLRTAIASREAIGEAKGILMAEQRCTADQAFELLRRASQRQNRKLKDIAEDLVARVEARAAEGE
jgi:hypothetical protein